MHLILKSPQQWNKVACPHGTVYETSVNIFWNFFWIYPQVFAHGPQQLPLGSGVTAPIPPDFFTLKWSWDPTFIFFLILALCYILGLRAYRGKAPVALWQRICFFAGIFVLTLAYLPPVDTWADQLFSAHMVQHLLITSIGVPLIIFGAPFFMFVKGLPESIRQNFLVPTAQNKTLRLFLGRVQSPLIAVILYELTFWFWHLPKFYDMALRNDAIHLLEHACMAFAALNLWQLLIDPRPLRSPLSLPSRFIFLLVVMTLDMVLSAGLTYSNHVWYAYSELPLPPGFQGDRLLDQQLGGLIMWVPGGLVWLVALILTFIIWVQREHQKDF